MKSRIIAILLVWVTTLAWFSRYIQTSLGSPLPTTWGVNIDWTRHHIVQSGHIQDGFSANTVISSYAGSQSYDFGSIFLAIINIVTGTQHLIEALETLNSFPFVGLVVFPLIFLYWHISINNGETKYIPLVLLLVYFPSATVIIKTASGWYTEPIATMTLLMIFILLPQIIISKRVFALIIIFVFAMFNLYHTWVFFFLLIVGTIYGGTIIFSRLEITSRTLPTPLFIIISLLFFIIGNHFNDRFFEFVYNIGLLIYEDDIGVFYDAATSPILGVTAEEALFNLNIRRITKIINYLSALSIVVMYISIKIHKITNHSENIFQNRYDYTLSMALLGYPFIILVFFAYGGISTSIGRTAYVGVYFVIFCAIILLKNENKSIRITTLILVFMMITSAASAAPLSKQFKSDLTFEEEEAIFFTGERISKNSYVFSDANLGPLLQYFKHPGIAIIQVTHKNWSENMKSIYFHDNNTKSLEAIRMTIQISRTASQAPPIKDYYILMSSNMNNTGVSTLSFVSKPIGRDPVEKFESNSEVLKIYSSGNVSLLLVNDDV